jgi:hypothetical protein
MAKKNINEKGSGKKRNWKKTILPLFLVAVMLISIFAYAGSSLLGSGDRDIILKKDFNNIADGLKLIPENASYVRYADIEANNNITLWLSDNLAKSIPSYKEFGAYVKKDMLSNYPYRYFGNHSQQFISVTDFGAVKLNQQYNNSIYNGIILEEINDYYFFTPEFDPVISGRPENVARAIDTIKGQGQKTAYNNYKDLFEQLKGYPVNEKNSKLSVVGRDCNVNFTDKYYAGITPDGKTYKYTAVMHLSHKFNDTEKQLLKSAWEQSALFNYGFDYFQANFVGDYLIIDASGNFNTCIRDMTTVWGFLQS